jgi:hypothetical protein
MLGMTTSRIVLPIHMNVVSASMVGATTTKGFPDPNIIMTFEVSVPSVGTLFHQFKDHFFVEMWGASLLQQLLY